MSSFFFTQIFIQIKFINSFYLGPSIPLADEDDEQEESSQHVAAVNDSEEDTNRFVSLAWLTIVMVDDEVDTLNDPQNTKNQKEFCVENLKRKYIHCI